MALAQLFGVAPETLYQQRPEEPSQIQSGKTNPTRFILEAFERQQSPDLGSLLTQTAAHLVTLAQEVDRITAKLREAEAVADKLLKEKK